MFLEVHEDPPRARSDAQNALRLDRLEPLLERLMAIDAIVKRAELPRPWLISRSRGRCSRRRPRRSWRWCRGWTAASIAPSSLLRQCRGRVILTGMGKSGIICRKIAATLTSTGTPAFFLHPAEAIHGDLGVIQADDVVVALSYSGETDEILRLLETIRRLGAKLVAMTGSPESTLAQAADVALDCSVAEEACPMNLVPTASTTAALAIGDALAMTLLVEKGFSEEDFASLHPGRQARQALDAVES